MGVLAAVLVVCDTIYLAWWLYGYTGDVDFGHGITEPLASS